MAYTYALMQEDETPEVSALMTASFPKSYRRIFFIKPEHTVVAREGNQVVGGMNMDVFSLPNKRKVGYLGWLYVEKDHQGQGIGNALTEQAIAHLKDVGCTDIIACVEGDNSSSLKQFANHGFTIMSIREQVSRFGIGLLKVNKRACPLL
jgi:ribosomal protein S18 acetylase RimI-like enzyme